MPTERQIEEERLRPPNREQALLEEKQIASAAAPEADLAELESQLEELNAKFRMFGERSMADHCYFLGIALCLGGLLALLAWYVLLNNGFLLPAILAIAVSLICWVAGAVSAVSGLRIDKMRCSSKTSK